MVDGSDASPPITAPLARRHCAANLRRRGGLALEVVNLRGDRRLHLIDLVRDVVDGLRELELLVDLRGDAVVRVEVGGGGRDCS